MRPSPVPASPGVYAWYFAELPPGLSTEGCISRGNLSLLYVGISPKRPTVDGGAPSRQTLRSRVRYHYRGNAEGSTLRLTLGCFRRTPQHRPLQGGQREAGDLLRVYATNWGERARIVVAG
jgi:hypothetical protein